MTGSLRQVRPGVWKVTVYAGGGKQKSATFEARGKQAAERASVAHVNRLLNDAEVRRQKAGTVAELVDRWQAQRSDRSHSPATLYREKVMVDRIVDQLGTVRLDELSGRHVDEFYGHLRGLNREPDAKKRPLSESTIHHHHRVLRSILRTGERWDMVDKVATARAKPPKPDKPTVRPPTLEAFTVLYRALPDNLKVPILILAGTGIRRGELFGLTWADVDLDNGRMWVPRSRVDVPGQAGRDKATKARQGRTVPLDAGMVALLDQWQRKLQRESGVSGPAVRVIPNLVDDPTGRTPMRPGWLSLAWKRHCEKHGAHVRLHDLRHMYLTWLLDAGVPINTVQGFAGHHDPSVTTSIYGHRTDVGEQRAIAAIGELVAGFTAP